jgi:hypothetical protein
MTIGILLARMCLAAVLTSCLIKEIEKISHGPMNFRARSGFISEADKRFVPVHASDELSDKGDTHETG